MSRGHIQLAEQSPYKRLVLEVEAPSWDIYHNRLLEAYARRCVRLNYAAGTIKGIVSYINSVLEFIQKPLWEIHSWDIERYSDALINSGASASTRRQKIGAFRRFMEWIILNYSREISEIYSVRVVQPVTEDSHIIHAHDDLIHKEPPPPKETIDLFFSFLSNYINRSPNPQIAGRDYTIYKLQYLVGLRIDEASMLDLNDIRYDLGDYGKIHVRFGKGCNTSGKRQRWVPMIDGADQLLKWYLQDVRGLFRKSKESTALFPSFQERRIRSESVSNSLTKYLHLAGIPVDMHWGTHKFRHACATYNYENGMSLVAIQRLLGHEDIKTTMIYVTPSSNYIESNYRSITSAITEKYKKHENGVD
ncbi:MAG: tyrosine-type recombinase/integrase [Acidobacteriota bacterium]